MLLTSKLKVSGILFIVCIFFLIISLISNCTSERTVIENEAYTWRNVHIAGGGFVDGIIFHPTTPGVKYCRTDMGGAYRWNDSDKVWEPLLDWLSYEDHNLMGVESMALDPSDPDRVYLACGTYTSPETPNGAVLRSDNRGETFQRTDMPFKMGGNENGRGNGERMAVDPNNDNILYLGTRHDGLWKSSDRGKSWQQVKSFPDIDENFPDSLINKNDLQMWYRQKKGSGIVFVIFDQESELAEGASSVIYAGVSLMGRNNIFRSKDAGLTWHAVPGQPVTYRPNHGVLAGDGILYISYGTNPGPWHMKNGGVWKLNTQTGEWKEITPEKPDPENGLEFGYAAVAVDATDPDIVMTSTFHRPGMIGGDDIFRSVDGGKSWKAVFSNGGKFDFTLAPYVARTPIHWMFDIEIDPNDPDHAMFTTGYGGYETFNLTNMDEGDATLWHVMSTGIEQAVALELLSPPQGAQLISAIGDYGGFVHKDLDKPVPEGNFVNPHFMNTNGVACAAQNPDVIVRVGIASGFDVQSNIGYSLDGGVTWQPAASSPENGSKLGHIAVSANGNAWIWTPEESPVYHTHDKGITWSRSAGIPNYIRVIADKVNPSVFYAVDLYEGCLYVSRDAGEIFEETTLQLPYEVPAYSDSRGDIRGGQDRIYATPGFEGDLWLAAFDGLYHTKNPEDKFSQYKNVKEIHAFGFGKAAPENNFPALYLVGVVKDVRGIFRSDDKAESWIRINDDLHQWGLLLHVTGDPKKYGRVYVGTHGRGIIYGTPYK